MLWSSSLCSVLQPPVTSSLAWYIQSTVIYIFCKMTEIMLFLLNRIHCHNNRSSNPYNFLLSVLYVRSLKLQATYFANSNNDAIWMSTEVCPLTEICFLTSWFSELTRTPKKLQNVKARSWLKI
jgi:hypothetical protein